MHVNKVASLHVLPSGKGAVLTNLERRGGGGARAPAESPPPLCTPLNHVNVLVFGIHKLGRNIGLYITCTRNAQRGTPL